MGKDIGRSYKYNRSKISTPTLKKPALSSSENKTWYTTSLSQTIISYQLENKDSTVIQNTSDISNTDDIQSCDPEKKLQCSGHIYNLLFDTIDHYFTSCTCWVNKNNRITPIW